ncbi:MAG TPA: hypothetical protein VGD52_26320 [Pseudoduganella sp.]
MEKDGATLRVHLQRHAATGRRPDERLFNTCPPGGEEIWRAYCQIGRSRPAGMGPAAISQSEIGWWQQNYGVRLSPWELDTLIEIDAAFMAAAKTKGST